MRQLFDYLRLIRFLNCILAGIGVGIGAWMLNYELAYYQPLVTSIAAFCVCAAGNCHNDLMDIDIDRVNRPYRVLPSGAISTRTATLNIYVFNVMAAGLAASVSLSVLVLVLISIGLLLLYNLKAKHWPLVGNMIIALLSGLVFIAGGISVEPQLALVLPGPLVPALFAFLFHLVREIVKDVEDIDGDSSAGLKTLPRRIGESKAMMLACGIFVLFVLVTLAPVLLGWFGNTYKILAVYIVDLPLLVLLILVWGNPTPRMLAFTSASLKVGMALGLVAILLA